MEFSQILSSLMLKNGITSYRVGKDTGISNRLVDYWKKGEKLPGAENLKKLATYFCVSTDFLLGKEQSKRPTTVTDDEPINPKAKKLVEMIKLMDDTQLDAIEAILDSVIRLRGQ